MLVSLSLLVKTESKLKQCIRTNISSHVSVSRESIRWSLLLSFRNDWWVEEKNSWRLGWVCNGSPLNPQSNEIVSPPFGSRWRKRRWLSQNCFWIDINKQICLLHTLWLFSFYEIIVSQFFVIRWSLTEKVNLKSIFDVKILIFCGYSYQPYATDLSITFSSLHL